MTAAANSHGHESHRSEMQQGIWQVPDLHHGSGGHSCYFCVLLDKVIIRWLYVKESSRCQLSFGFETQFFSDPRVFWGVNGLHSSSTKVTWDFSELILSGLLVLLPLSSGNCECWPSIGHMFLSKWKQGWGKWMEVRSLLEAAGIHSVR